MNTDGDRVHGGVLKVDCPISCEAATETASCPAATLRTGTTVIACGEQEGGVMHDNIAHLKPLTVKLHITEIRFESWRQGWIDRVNDQYSPWPNGTPACADGSDSPTSVSNGTN